MAVACLPLSGGPKQMILQTGIISIQAGRRPTVRVKG
jgi:hypothetical protein